MVWNLERSQIRERISLLLGGGSLLWFIFLGAALGAPFSSPGLEKVTASSSFPQKSGKKRGSKKSRSKNLRKNKKDPGTEIFQDPNETLLMFPLGPTSCRRSSKYGLRLHPLKRGTKFHYGVDYAAHLGAPVYAAGPGIVKFSGFEEGYGNYVEIKHPGSFVTLYGHLSKIDVKAGEEVRRGQLLGRVGSTGHATGPHLHYGVYYKNRFTNPEKVLHLYQNPQKKDFYLLAPAGKNPCSPSPR